jgi:aspartate/methionine/tyrosine aminotransferase
MPSEIAELCVKHNVWVLSDEAYFDLVFGMTFHLSLSRPASLHPLLFLQFSHSIPLSVFSLAKPI